MSTRLSSTVLAGLIAVLFSPLPCLADLSYDIVYVRIPRPDDTTRMDIPEVKDPIRVPPNTDLMLLHPDGSEELLVPGGDGAIVDPYVSYDGLWVYYSKFHDQRTFALDSQRPGDPSRKGADIYKINLQTREIVQLTNQEWTPNTGVVAWSGNHMQAEPDKPYYLGYGVFNLGPCPLPGGKVMFSSSRNNYIPNNSFTAPNLQLFVMDNDGSNVELVGHMNLGSALHPTVLMDGRVMFSSYEAQGLRDSRVWGLWAMWPDGRKWEPLMSAFAAQNAFHFQTQLSNGDICVLEYYNQNNNSFGTALAFPVNKDPNLPPFGSAVASGPGNDAVQRGIWWFDDSHPNHKKARYKKYSFSPPGIYALTAFSHGEDNSSSRNQSGDWAGKVTHPSGAPDNDVLIVWTPGPANDLNRPTNLPRYDGGIYIIKGGTPVDDESAMTCIKNDPNFNELQPRAVVSYHAIYGIDEPATLPWLVNDGSENPALEPGTPFALVGTSSFYRRDTKPGSGDSAFDGLDPFNTSENGASSNWSAQGADAGKYSNSDIYAVRILAMEPSSNVSRGPGTKARVQGFRNHADERLRILGEIPLRKTDELGAPVLDPDGNPDTSFLAKIPADTPFTFQTIDKDGLVLNVSQTWHQLRPGEVRNDCGGCHSHSQKPLDFNQTAASRPMYSILDLTKSTPLISKDIAGDPVITTKPDRAVDVEFHRDIKPILQRSCVGCHSKDNPEPAAQLVLDDDSSIDGYEGTYTRLASDSSADFGIKPVISNGSWRQTNASRYVRKFQSRRSLLIWKIFGRRLDGWTNADHPTESVPGDKTTLPAGVSANKADIDYLGTIMPPPDADPNLYPPLSEDEKILFARWVDLGCPITSQGSGVLQDLGWFADELRPTLDISLPRAGRQSGPLTKIRFGAFDYYSGVEMATLSIKADFPLGGRAPGTELSDAIQPAGDHVWEIDLTTAPITNLNRGTFTVSISDTSGNITNIVRTFSVGESTEKASLQTSTSQPQNGNFHFKLQGEPQATHRILTSSDLSDWNPWLTIRDFDGQQNIVDPNVAGGTRKFYTAEQIEP
jgi:hypothetical protein